VPDRVKKERKADGDKTDCRIDKRKGHQKDNLINRQQTVRDKQTYNTAELIQA
jgi:hypothetical protein